MFNDTDTRIFSDNRILINDNIFRYSSDSPYLLFYRKILSGETNDNICSEVKINQVLFESVIYDNESNLFIKNDVIYEESKNTNLYNNDNVGEKDLTSKNIIYNTLDKIRNKMSQDNLDVLFDIKKYITDKLHKIEFSPKYFKSFGN